jgi:hypothetical protein
MSVKDYILGNIAWCFACMQLKKYVKMCIFLHEIEYAECRFGFISGDFGSFAYFITAPELQNQRACTHACKGSQNVSPKMSLNLYKFFHFSRFCAVIKFP